MENSLPLMEQNGLPLATGNTTNIGNKTSYAFCVTQLTMMKLGKAFILGLKMNFSE
jgi:hypothetical protein